MLLFTGTRPNPPQDYIENRITNGHLGKPDYEGAVFSDGTCVLRWLTDNHSTSIFEGPNGFDAFMRIHGHPEYGTEIRKWELI